MTSVKYIGLDVHQATIVVAVCDESGKLIMESVVETRASTILDFIDGLRGKLFVALEEGISADWLYNVLKPHVDYVMVCDPRKSSKMKAGSKNDHIDARDLSELLRGGQLQSVYHGDPGVRTLKELARSYMTLTEDVTRVMNRIKSVYRSQAIRCAGPRVYSARYRAEWLNQLQQPGQQRRAEHLHQQFDLLQPLRMQARQELLKESQRYPARATLQKIPWVGPIRAALLIALVQTPHRFRNELQRSKKKSSTRGLNVNHNHDLKNLFKSMAVSASTRRGLMQDYYEGLLANGVRPAMARLTLARKFAAIVLVLWKKGESFDPKKLTSQAA